MNFQLVKCYGDMKKRLKIKLQNIVKVARPGFSLTIPTLFEHEIQRCLKRNRKSSYTYLKGIDQSCEKARFFRDRRSHSNRVTPLLFLLFLNL